MHDESIVVIVCGRLNPSHPPCNSGNSCTMIIEEIRRNLVGYRDSATLPAAETMTRAAWPMVARMHAT